MVPFLDGPEIIVLLTVVVIGPLYFLPIIIAARRKSPKLTAIVILSILLGWTGIGWLAALVLALTSPRPIAGAGAPHPGAAAGWHPDPHGAARLRYFDGNSWTDHTAT